MIFLDEPDPWPDEWGDDPYWDDVPVLRRVKTARTVLDEPTFDEIARVKRLEDV